ncbi:MAG: TetR/AcrR family transcriptional regulator [Leptolyngbya sp. UWPOB_LEPTO1]|uniref:TetR/AcrR family transcriptional regulator n=1 Tax=Leptolyngbya sp. UWPOB_LEPTO1 TaxID=2815653 RepID=UPI001AC60C65|nr:TetR/AcrR family transcriptional regulator [Leptolyngbya sp. UWPOB_LEPTO1]MBN8564916.1 TetR/AcrR family transcriptional regulator [Leptolyngbya sp. UWPOB_LEPTO1]
MPKLSPERQVVKREQILKGAMTVFLTSGYAGTSMDRVAAEAGVSKQTIYSYFQDKEGLFRSLIEQATIIRFTTLFELDHQTVEPEQLLRRLAEIFFNDVVDRGNYIPLLRIVIGESERFPELARLYTQAVVQRGKAMLCEYLRSHKELKLHDPEAIAQIFFGSMVSWVILQKMLYGEELMQLSRDRVVDQLVHLILSNSDERKIESTPIEKH